MIDRPPPPPLVGLFMLSLFVTCDLLWPVGWDFQEREAPYAKKTDGRQPSSPRDPTTTCRTRGSLAHRARRDGTFSWKARSAGSARNEPARDGEGLPAINDRRNERPCKIAP